MAKDENWLTPKQKKFADEYMKTGNGTQSALKTYNTTDYDTASSIAKENLRKPQIQWYCAQWVEDAKKMMYTIAMTWEKEENRIRACKDVIDRGEWLPTQKVEQKTEHTGNISITELSDEDLQKMLVDG